MPIINDATVVNSAYDTRGNGGRKLVRLSNGWLVAQTINRTTNSILIYLSKNNGATWGQSLSISGILSGSDSCIISSGNIVHLIYMPVSSPSGVIQHRPIRIKSDETDLEFFSAWQSVDTSQTALGSISLASNEAGTELHAAWASKNSTYPNSFNIRYAKGTINSDGSVTWGAVEQVTNYNISGIDISNPSALPDGKIVSDYSQTGVTQSIVIFDKNSSIKKYFVGNSNWGNAPIYAPATNHTQSSSSAIFVPQRINGLPNGRIWVSWYGRDSTENYQHIRVSYSDDGGINWSAVQKITSGTAVGVEHYHPSITANKNNEIFIVWWGRDSTSQPQNIRKIKHDGNAWGAISTVTDNVSTNALYPSALFDLSLNFSEPLFIYQDNEPAKVGFYGTWTVTANSIPSGPLGTKTDRNALLTYAITTDGTMSTITEKVNGVTVGTKTAASGQSLTASLTQAQWDAVKYGKYKDGARGLNTLEITMGDDKWTYTFDKRPATGADLLTAVKAAQDSQSTYLPAVKAQLGAAIRGKGGAVSDTDSFEAMAAAVGGISTKRWASGTFSATSGSVSVTGLAFKPKIIIIEGSATANNFYRKVYFEDSINSALDKAGIRYYSNTTDIYYTNAWIVTENSFSTTTNYVGTSGTLYYWYAFE